MTPATAGYRAGCRVVTRYVVPADYLLDPGPDGALVTLSGHLSAIRHRTTNQGRSWLSGTLSTPNGRIHIDVHPAAYAAAEWLDVDQPVTVTARVDLRHPGPARLMTLTVTRSTPVVIEGQTRSILGRG